MTKWKTEENDEEESGERGKRNTDDGTVWWEGMVGETVIFAWGNIKD